MQASSLLRRRKAERRVSGAKKCPSAVTPLIEFSALSVWFLTSHIAAIWQPGICLRLDVKLCLVDVNTCTDSCCIVKRSVPCPAALARKQSSADTGTAVLQLYMMFWQPVHA